MTSLKHSRRLISETLLSQILNSKQRMGPLKQSQFHTPPISTHKSAAHQTPQKGRNVFDIPGHKRRYQGKEFHPNSEPWIPPQKEVPGFSLFNPLNVYWKGSTNEQGEKGKGRHPGNAIACSNSIDNCTLTTIDPLPALVISQPHSSPSLSSLQRTLSTHYISMTAPYSVLLLHLILTTSISSLSAPLHITIPVFLCPTLSPHHPHPTSPQCLPASENTNKN